MPFMNVARPRATNVAAGLVVLVCLQNVSDSVFAQPARLCHKCDSHAPDCSDVPDEPALPGGFDTREAMNATDVLHVDLDLELLFSTQRVSGTCKMTVRNVSASPLSQFTFRLRRDSFTITQSTVTDPQNNNQTSSITVTASSQTTRVATLNRAYQPGEQFVLSITYNGAPANLGFGSFDWTMHAGAVIGESLSEPYYSYSWWPIKDGDVFLPGDNSDKFTIDEHYTVPSALLAPGNGILASVDTLPDIGNGNGPRKRFNWTTNYPISSYLVLVAATNYTTPALPDPWNGRTSWTLTYTTGTGGSMPVYFYIWPEDDTPSNRAAWSKCVDMLSAYRGRYGEYPFVDEKYGIYEFNFGGGMEHQTMTGQGTFAEYVTAHELGHQWWGDMITCKTWNDIWLNEGFATFTEAMWAELNAYPGPANFANYLSYMNGLRPSDATLRSGTNYGGTVYRTDLSSTGTIFSSTYSYRKGGWCLHMLRYLMGDTVFFQTLANYRAAFEYGAATTDDFAAICSATYGQDLTWFFNQWVYGPGDPDYTFASQALSTGGQTYLQLYIKQVQQAANPTWPIFTMPVDIRYGYTNAQGQAATTTVRVPWNADSPATNERWLTIPVAGTSPTSVQFDPDYRILRPSVTSVAYAAGPPVILSTSPAPGATRSAAANTTSVSVVYQMDVTTTAANYTLVGATVGAVPTTLSYNATTRTATLTAAAPLAADHYTFTVSDNVVAAVGGKRLDGEIATPPAFPTGNGIPGGSTVISFDIVGSPADINGDNVVNSADLDLFVQVLLQLNTNPTYVARSDFNSSGTADGEDIPGFLAAYY